VEKAVEIEADGGKAAVEIGELTDIAVAIPVSDAKGSCKNKVSISETLLLSLGDPTR